MKDRLLELRNYLNLNQIDFGEKVGLSKASISALEGGMRNITDRHIMLIVSTFKVNEDWLRTGKGEMFVQPKTFTLDEKAKEYNLTDLEIEIMKNYMQLDEEVRKNIMGMLKKSFDSVSVTTDGIDIDEEVDNYRQELEASRKAQKSSVSENTKDKTS